MDVNGVSHFSPNVSDNKLLAMNINKAYKDRYGLQGNDGEAA